MKNYLKISHSHYGGHPSTGYEKVIFKKFMLSEFELPDIFQDMRTLFRFQDIPELWPP